MEGLHQKKMKEKIGAEKKVTHFSELHNALKGTVVAKVLFFQHSEGKTKMYHNIHNGVRGNPTINLAHLSCHYFVCISNTAPLKLASQRWPSPHVKYGYDMKVGTFQNPQGNISSERSCHLRTANKEFMEQGIMAPFKCNNHCMQQGP